LQNWKAMPSSFSPADLGVGDTCSAWFMAVVEFGKGLL
jgi:hypothetical protein